MKWKYVFNGNVVAGTHISEVQSSALRSGYLFFLFNGIVYFIPPKGEACTTGIEYDDLY